MKKSAGVIVKSGNKCLLCKRSNVETYSGEWSIPGGKVEPGEEIIDSYKSLRDGLVFTTKRIIVVNKKGKLGKKVDYEAVKQKIKKHFETIFDCELVY